jgi:hypothetical protein
VAIYAREKKKRTDSIGPFSIHSRFCLFNAGGVTRSICVTQIELVLSLSALLRHGLFSVVLRDAKAVPTDAGIHTRSAPRLQSKDSKKRLFIRILTDIQVVVKGGSR